MLAFIAQIVSSLVWPVVVLVFIAVFREPLRELIGRTEQVKTKLGQVKFSSWKVIQAGEDLPEPSQVDIQDVSRILPGIQVNLKSIKKETDLPLPKVNAVDKQRTIKRQSPSKIIQTAWQQLAEAVSELAGEMGCSGSLDEQLRVLESHGISTNIISGIRTLASEHDNVQATKAKNAFDKSYAESYSISADKLILNLQDEMGAL